jgi:hypothetical protein
MLSPTCIHLTGIMAPINSFPSIIYKFHGPTEYSKIQRHLPQASSSSIGSVSSPCPSLIQEGKSTTTDFGSTSVVYGFSKEKISISRRSETRLDSLAHDSKTATFRVELEEPSDKGLENDPETSDNAIEDDDDDMWVDVEDKASQEDLFQRVDSMPSLRSRPSLLTNMLQDAASRTSHNGSLGTLPQNENKQPQLSRARPIDQQPSESMPLVLSPRMSKRNMLSTELTGSLRKHMLWERQKRNLASTALKNRQFRNEIGLTDHVNNPHLNSSNSTDNSEFYSSGITEYFEKGW